MALLDEEPRLVRRMLGIAVARLAASNNRESALAFLNAPARVARILREMDEVDRQTADRGYVTLSQEELAQRTGLTRQTVARFLGDWRRAGWLLTGRGRIMLLKRAELLHIEEQSIL
jgi:CRP-like cAMP-binding protein